MLSFPPHTPWCPRGHHGGTSAPAGIGFQGTTGAPPGHRRGTDPLNVLNDPLNVLNVRHTLASQHRVDEVPDP